MADDFRVIIAGTRDFDNYTLLCEYADKMLANRKEAGYNIIIVSGCATGADTLGEQYAEARGYQVERYPAQWRDANGRYDKGAGVKRNALMADNADALLAYWDGKSRGTKNMINEATKRGLLVRIKRY